MPPNLRIGTRVALLYFGKRERRTSGTEGLPPRPTFVAKSCQVPRPKAEPPSALGIQPPRKRPLPISRRSHSPNLRSPRLPLPQGRRSFFGNCRLQIADCRL